MRTTVFVTDVAGGGAAPPRVWKKAAALVSAFAGCLAAAAGCERAAPEPPKAEPPVIPVSKPVRREITDYVYYTGRVDAPQSVDVRARVTGYLIQTPFKEGAEVKEDDLLFEIDPRPYQAQYDASKAQVELKQANFRLAKSEYARSRAINTKSAGAISAEELEKNAATEAQAQADVDLAKANFGLSKLDLDYTKVYSPVDGLVSRYYYTRGNLITMDQTLLTTVVSVDPMYVFFDMDERTILRIRTLINEGKIAASKDVTEIPLDMGLEGEAGYPHHGNLNFVNNMVSLSTGTITVRGVFENPLPKGGRRLLTPGMFVRVQLPVGAPHSALLVAERALGSDQGARFVYVVDPSNKAQYRRVEAGPQQEDGLIAIEKGLDAEDLVVVGALPQVRPRMEIRPDPTAMPTLGSDDEADGHAAEGKGKADAGPPPKGGGSTARPQPPPPGGRPAPPKTGR